MPKYIFREKEYAKWVNKKYEDHVHEDYTGRKYKQTRVRYWTLPGDSDAKDKYGFSSGMWMGANSFAPGGVYEAHRHKTPQFYYVLSGRAKVRVGDEERIAVKGTWVFTPPGVDHYVENIGKTPFTYILMGGNPDYGKFSDTS
jgi:mannose-6-phosphate isomerase-like protein (cupin superfamily)